MKKKKSSMVTKKPIFWKMFIKRLLIFAVIVAIGGVVGTYIVSYFYGMYMESETSNMGNAFADEVFRQYDSNGDSEQFEKSVSLSASFYSFANRMYIMVDKITGEVVARPSEDTLFLSEYSNTGDSLHPKMDVYTCESAEIVNAIKESEAATGCTPGTTYISADDVYLKGYAFIPGKIKIMTFGDEEDSILAELDFTPEDTTGYEYKDMRAAYQVGKSYHVMSYFDLSLTPEVIQCMEETVTKLDDWNLEMAPASAFNDVGSPGDNTCFFDTSIETEEEVGEEGYRIIGICHYNFFEDWIWECMLAYIVLAIVTLTLAVVTSTVSYMKQKNFYEMDQYRRDMTNTMAHDLKSPLMIISGFAENLLEQNLDEKSKHFTKSIVENVDYMNRLIEKTLELSKVENADYKLHKEVVDLREVTNGLVQRYFSQLEKRGLEIQISGECTINADKICMTEVIDNLISNAIKYAIEGSVIEVCLEKRCYEISNASAVDFDMDVQNLLKPFVKGDNSRSGKNGSGIGLTIAKNLCEQHGYKLNVECNDGIFVAKIEV